jgi:hypothetical protein
MTLVIYSAISDIGGFRQFLRVNPNQALRTAQPRRPASPLQLTSQCLLNGLCGGTDGSAEENGMKYA